MIDPESTISLCVNPELYFLRLSHAEGQWDVLVSVCVEVFSKQIFISQNPPPFSRDDVETGDSFFRILDVFLRFHPECDFVSALRKGFNCRDDYHELAFTGVAADGKFLGSLRIEARCAASVCIEFCLVMFIFLF